MTYFLASSRRVRISTAPAAPTPSEPDAVTHKHAAVILQLAAVANANPGVG